MNVIHSLQLNSRLFEINEINGIAREKRMTCIKYFIIVVVRCLLKNLERKYQDVNDT